MAKIYLDYAATTPVDPQVLQIMLPYFSTVFGNPSSIHNFGQEADHALDEARTTTARLLNCRKEEIVFTSCGTESDNLALRGVAFAQLKSRGLKHILISPVEHHAVSHTAEQLKEVFGFDLEYLDVDEYGIVKPDELESRIRSDTALVSVIYANNEIGSINPISEIGKICREKGVPFHSDAVQAGAHLRIDVQKDRLDLLSLGGHKMYGPKGVGALYVRAGVPMLPSQTGGKQEGGLRAGTQNLPLIVGFSEALRIANIDLDERSIRLSKLRDRLIDGVLRNIPGSRLTGHPVQRLPNHASFVFEGADGNYLLTLLDIAGFACSSGSACKVGNPQPSEVLEALGLSRTWALGSLRITLGKDSTEEIVDQLLEKLPALVQKARRKI